MQNVKFFLIIFCLSLIYLFNLNNLVYAESSGSSGFYGFPDLTSLIKFDSNINFCGEAVPINNQEVKERLERELLVTLWNRPLVTLWMKRAGRYMPHIEKVLRENAMPDDLKYVVFIESSLLPHAGSAKHAVGLWQFIPSTGKNFGLSIDKDLDQRKNVLLSTQAAIKYLKKLYNNFGSWTLACAAYNMGENGLKEDIYEQKTNNYYYLYLPRETQEYIPKIVAAKIILSEPQKYGFFLSDEDLYKPLQYDKVSFELPLQIHIQSIAEAADTYFKVIKDLNPDVKGSYLSKGHHSILIPKGSGNNFNSKLEKILSQIQQNNPKTKQK